MNINWAELILFLFFSSSNHDKQETQLINPCILWTVNIEKRWVSVNIFHLILTNIWTTDLYRCSTSLLVSLKYAQLHLDTIFKNEMKNKNTLNLRTDTMSFGCSEHLHYILLTILFIIQFMHYYIIISNIIDSINSVLSRLLLKTVCACVWKCV